MNGINPADKNTLPPPFGGEGSVGPSVVRQDDMKVGRFIGLVSACVTLFSGMVMVLSMYGYRNMLGFGPAWSAVGIALGLIGLLFHASYDRDIEFRRIYLFLGLGAMALGMILCAIFVPRPLALFPYGFFLMLIGLLFQTACLRTETDSSIRSQIQVVLGVAGAMLAVISMLGGLWFAGGDYDFLIPHGLLLAVLGLLYLVASVEVKGVEDDRSYRIGSWGIGGFGGGIALLALFRSWFPGLFQSSGGSFFIPWGLLLTALGVTYLLASRYLVSESRLAVMLRRELGAYFYSPMAYMILFGFAVAHWISYALTVYVLRQDNTREPIVINFILQLVPIFFVLFAVPALTMRLVSEESRAGTLEVTLTAPLDEWQVILSKFLAGLIMYLIMWVPFALLLIAFRIIVETNFDYRPLLSFSIALVLSGAAFISMGLFFSTLTRNAVISGVLTFTAMVFLVGIYFVERYFARDQVGMVANNWVLVVLKHLSFIDLWFETLQGQLIPRMLMFPITITIFWLFLSVKVLEARKWL